MSRNKRQVDLSEAPGVSLTWIWILETSQEKNVSREVKERVARALEMEVIQLFPDEAKEER